MSVTAGLDRISLLMNAGKIRLSYKYSQSHRPTFAVHCQRVPKCCLPGACSVSIGAVFWGFFVVIQEAIGIPQQPRNPCSIGVQWLAVLVSKSSRQPPTRSLRQHNPSGTSFINQNKRKYHSEVAKLMNLWMIFGTTHHRLCGGDFAFGRPLLPSHTVSMCSIWQAREPLPGVPTHSSHVGVVIFGSMAHSAERET